MGLGAAAAALATDDRLAAEETDGRRLTERVLALAGGLEGVQVYGDPDAPAPPPRVPRHRRHRAPGGAARAGPGRHRRPLRAARAPPRVWRTPRCWPPWAPTPTGPCASRWDGPPPTPTSTPSPRCCPARSSASGPCVPRLRDAPRPPSRTPGRRRVVRAGAGGRRADPGVGAARAPAAALQRVAGGRAQPEPGHRHRHGVAATAGRGRRRARRTLAGRGHPRPQRPRGRVARVRPARHPRAPRPTPWPPPGSRPWSPGTSARS